MLHALISFILFFHPFYVSVTEIRHNEKTKSLEISSRIFANDLEAILEKNYRVQIDILSPSDRKKVDELIADYLKNHLKLTINGKALPMNYLGYAIEEDGAWCYFEIPKINAVKRISIVNNILFAEHATQTNMLHVTVKGKRKSTKLDNPASTVSFEF